MDELYDRSALTRSASFSPLPSTPSPSPPWEYPSQGPSTLDHSQTYESVINFDTPGLLTPGPGIPADASYPLIDHYRGMTLVDLTSPLDGRPPEYPMHVLMQVAIQSSPMKKLRQCEIRDALIERFPYFSHAGKTWRNTLRHALTNRASFYKVPKPPNVPGRGAYWSFKFTKEPKRKSRATAQRSVRGTTRKRRNSQSDDEGDSEDDDDYEDGPSETITDDSNFSPSPPTTHAGPSTLSSPSSSHSLPAFSGTSPYAVSVPGTDPLATSPCNFSGMSLGAPPHHQSSYNACLPSHSQSAPFQSWTTEATHDSHPASLPYFPYPQADSGFSEVHCGSEATDSTYWATPEEYDTYAGIHYQPLGEMVISAYSLRSSLPDLNGALSPFTFTSESLDVASLSTGTSFSGATPSSPSYRACANDLGAQKTGYEIFTPNYSLAANLSRFRPPPSNPPRKWSAP